VQGKVHRLREERYEIVKKLWIGVLALIILAGACSRPGKVVVLSWQRPQAAACKGCEKCGPTQAEMQKAAAQLNEKLAGRGVRVRVEEAVGARPGKKAIVSGTNVWVCDVPLETWLGAGIGVKPCDCSSGGQSMSCKVVNLNGQSYQVIPADLVVRAGLLAADMLIEQGSIDPAAVKTPRGCAGCPSAGVCGAAK